MEIINLADNYVKYVLRDNDLPAYEQTSPALFRHYFRYWADRDRFVPTLDAAQVPIRIKLVTGLLDCIVRKLAALGLNTSGLRVVLFVGQNTSNGHAFQDGDTFAVWIPIETYKTRLDTEVFVTHEIIHALHYTYSKEFYFHDIQQKCQVSRQLITEGLSTYLSKVVLNVNDGTALWADYLSSKAVESWLARCYAREQELKRYILDNFSSSDPEIGLFYANNQGDIFHYRAGYYVGLKFVEQVALSENLTPPQLLGIPRKEFESRALEYLKS